MKRIKYVICTAVCCMMLVSGCHFDSKESTDARNAGIEQLKSGNYEEAIQSFDNAISHAKGLVGNYEYDILKYRGEAEYMAEDYKAAANTYDLLIQIDEDRPEYRYLRSMSYAKSGEIEKALEDYNAAAEKEPEFTGSLKALLTLGTALEENDRFDDAADLYEKAAEKTHNASIYSHLASCMIKKEDYDKALEYIESAIALNDGNIMKDLKYDEAVIWEHKGDFKKALELFETYVDTYGSNETIEHEMAFLRTR